MSTNAQHTTELLAIAKQGTRAAEGASRKIRSKEEIEAERALIIAVQDGDKTAFETLVRSYEKKVFWIAYNLLNNVEDAKDVAQDAFLRVFKAVHRFDLKFNFYTWLYRIVVNLAIDRLRKRGKQGTVSIEEFPTDPETESGPEEELRNSERGRKILEVLDSMPQKYRLLIVLRDVQQMGCEEISKIIGCTNATTRWRLHKAREIFKAKWSRITV